MTAIASLNTRPNVKPAAHESTSNANAADARLKALPTPAREKFERLRRAELRSRALHDGLYDQQRAVRESRDLTIRDLAIFDRHNPPEFSYEDDPKTGERKRVPAVFPERVALLDRIENYKSELTRLSDEQRSANLGYSTDDILNWLASQSAKFITAPVSLKLSKGETLTDALARNGEALAAVRDQLAAVESAPPTVAEMKSAMRAEVAALVEKGKPDVSPLSYGQPIAWPSEQFQAGGNGAHQYTVVTTVKDAFAFCVFLNQEATLTALDAEIEKSNIDASALSRDVQAARVAELQAALLQLQRQAEAIAERLEGDGISVRRVCVDPIVLLGIEQARQ